MQFELAYTIVNNTGEKLTFVRIYQQEGKEFLEAENEVEPNAGPPMHVHFRQDECLNSILPHRP